MCSSDLGATGPGHVAFAVESDDGLAAWRSRLEGRGVEIEAELDWPGGGRSIYFRDPNGYVIELTASTGKHGEIMDPVISKPHEALAHWQATKGH